VASPATTAGLPALVLGLAGLLTSWVLASPAAGAITSTTVPPAHAGLVRANQRVSADRARAAEISAEIQAQGILLAKYAERADAESVLSGQLDRRLGATRSASRSAAMDVLGTRRLLVAQAIAAYTEGGAFSYAPGTVRGTSLVVAAAYAEAVAQRQQLAIRDYRRALSRDKAVSTELSHQIASVRTVARRLAADRAAAAAQQSSLRATLAGVKGDLALAVDEVERQQAAVQAEEEKALLESLHQLPASTPVMAARRPPPVSEQNAGPATSSAGGGGPVSSAPALDTGQTTTSAARPLTTLAPSRSEVALAAATTSAPAPTTTAPPSPSTTSTSVSPPSTEPPTTSTSLAPTTMPPTTVAPTTVAPTTVAPTTVAPTTVPVATFATPGTSVSSTTAPAVTTTSIPSTTTTTAAGPSSTATSSAAVTTTTLAAGTASAVSLAANAGAAAGSGGSGSEATYPTSAGTAVTTLTAPTTTAPAAATAGLPPPGWQVALAFAESQMGKPYQWGGAGPGTYDCSGLTMVAWGKAGVYMPHSAQDQYNMTARVPIGELQPGDLVFFGTPSDVYHVGMYVGGGTMVDAPETGQDVMIQPIYELNLLGGGRP
jgi:peptidoglycan DL-endopeptidase CwlO